MADPNLEHQTVDIRKLIAQYQEGKLVIPEFQRDYVWKPGQAPTLLDSLYRGWPISSLLVWESEDEVVESRRNEPRHSRSVARWLIDGQQRVITLSRIANGDEGIDVVFNAKTEEFARPNAATRQDRQWVQVTELWNDEQYRSIVRSLPEDNIGRRTQERYERVRRILAYEVPVVEMVGHAFDHAVGAFTRINTLGYRLKKQDIESAKIAAKHSGFIRRRVVPFLRDLHGQGFTRIHVTHLFRVCAFIAHPDGRSRTPLHELERKQVDAAWRETERATLEAIGLVRSEFGLVDMSVLWSASLLVPVIALCARLAPRDRNTKELAGWMALASLHHRYSRAAETALDEDLKACRAEDPIRALLAILRDRHGKLRAAPNHFTGSLADRSALFAAWVACRFSGAKDLLGTGTIVLQPRIDRHHILARALFVQKRRAEADTLANIAFISGSTNRSIGDDVPERYLSNIKRDVLRSQCIPDDPALWPIGVSARFWEKRRELLAGAFNSFLDNHLAERKLGRAR